MAVEATTLAEQFDDLVRFARENLPGCDVVGTDLGWITTRAAGRGIP